jgi:hypothetical protein
LDAEASVSVLEALRRSRLYRADQHSYMLYPDTTLPSFLDKNTVPPEQAERSELIGRLLADANTDLIAVDVDGALHFNSTFQNIRDVSATLDRLSRAGYGELVAEEAELVAEIFESVFHHRQFTGRSGAFYGYEGLGCIYWHMVSKLLLAVHECCLTAGDAPDGVHRRLVDAYWDIRAGLGFNKSPQVYGAFPTDPYSHTPGLGGARQPGMTGQVKEEIITRRAELGLTVREGRISVDPVLLRQGEFLPHPASFEYFDLAGEPQSLHLEEHTLAFTVCQVPFVVHRGTETRWVVRCSDGTDQTLRRSCLDREWSREIFMRTGRVSRVDIVLSPGGAVGREPGSGGGVEPSLAGGAGP